MSTHARDFSDAMNIGLHSLSLLYDSNSRSTSTKGRNACRGTTKPLVFVNTGKYFILLIVVSWPRPTIQSVTTTYHAKSRQLSRRVATQPSPPAFLLPRCPYNTVQPIQILMHVAGTNKKRWQRPQATAPGRVVLPSIAPLDGHSQYAGLGSACASQDTRNKRSMPSRRRGSSEATWCRSMSYRT